MKKRFDPGDVLFRQGDPSDFAVLILTGSADVLRDLGSESIVLGSVQAGEVVGEMGVLDGQPRSATVRAVSPLEAELIEHQAFLDRVSGEPELARKLLVRMSARLREVDDALTQLYTGEPTNGSESRELVETQPQLPEGSAICIVAAGHPGTRSLIGADPIRVENLPFTVGRELRRNDRAAGVVPDLAIHDNPPFRLSRAHFSIMQRGSALVVQDLASSLGTIVNDRPLGRSFSTNSAPLNPGANTVIAGGAGSAYVFSVTVPQVAWGTSPL